jgi:hypothetical protein
VRVAAYSFNFALVAIEVAASAGLVVRRNDVIRCVAQAPSIGLNLAVDGYTRHDRLGTAIDMPSSRIRK